jgi:hypothetical protein
MTHEQAVLVFHACEKSDATIHFAALAKCFGIGAVVVDLRSPAATADAISGATGVASIAAVLDLDSLKHCADDEIALIEELLLAQKSVVLLLCTSDDPAASELLHRLTGSQVCETRALANSRIVEFSSELTHAAELASLKFTRSGRQTLALSFRGGVEVIMSLDQRASYVRVARGHAEMFAWSTSEVFDPFRRIATELEFEESLDEYIPAIMYLRRAFGPRCFHNPNAFAAIVIDDPLLRARYGFIDFPKLLRSAREHNYRLTLGFIPWNYWRTGRKQARAFAEFSDCFGICVHGCDHTKNEFRSDNYEHMLAKCFLATNRMRVHQHKTGIACEPLMVCPQEQYSEAAMRAFAASGAFLAVVNTGCMPRHLSGPAICGADLLTPAQDSFYGFPVFKRHYGVDLAAYAMALFLGKPAIMAAHHDFFRHGPADTEKFAAQLVRICPRLRWRSLHETCAGTYLRRTGEGGGEEIRFFTNVVQIENANSSSSHCRFLRRLPIETRVLRVTINQREVAFSHSHEELEFWWGPDTASVFKIEVELQSAVAARARFGVGYQCSVAARRALSEFRDNVVSRNAWALKIGRKTMKSLRQTSG